MDEPMDTSAPWGKTPAGQYDYDYLTGLPRGTYFNNLADQKRAEIAACGKEAAFVCVDLNGMKVFNRKYGYTAGDQLLVAVAALLAEIFGLEHCGHLGQDRFAVCVEKDGLEEKLELVFCREKEFNHGASLPMRAGICLDQDGSLDARAAFDRAKLACDEMRSSFTSEFRYFSAELLDAADRRHYLRENLDQALAEGWIEVYYQPIVRAATGRVCDEEALSRWVDPVHGRLSPLEFIPILEDCRQIYKLDLYVLDQVLRDLRWKLDHKRPVLPVSVNLSRADFDSCDIVREICRRVDEAGIDRGLINVEITESTAGQDPDYMRRQIDLFREEGFQVWMDDFGSGFSSLDVLQTFRFDLIKFDLEFMRQFNNSEKNHIILSQLMKMILMLEIETLVEGVETEEQMAFLRGIGAGRLQGMLFSAPRPLSEINARQDNGTWLEMEDNREADYYAAISSANLFDPAFLYRSRKKGLHANLDAVPMAILELRDGNVRVLRHNSAYEAFLLMAAKLERGEWADKDIPLTEQNGLVFEGMAPCFAAEEWTPGRTIMVDKVLINSQIKRIAVNSVTGAVAAVEVIMTVL